MGVSNKNSSGTLVDTKKFELKTETEIELDDKFAEIPILETIVNELMNTRV